MTTESRASGSESASVKATSIEGSPASPGEAKQAISPAERWLRIRENAYTRAQRRGFVGGNPFADWLEAEKEVDAAYVTDVRRMLSLTDPAEITKRIENILSLHGLDHLSVDALLVKHREGMERLTAFNRTLMDSTSELARQQVALAQDALQEAMSTLQSVAQGKMSTDGMAKQAALSMKAMENALSHVKALTEAVAGISPGTGKDTSSTPRPSSRDRATIDTDVGQRPKGAEDKSPTPELDSTSGPRIR